jgi:hypothetical protein
MADSPQTTLHFRGICPDCGVREAHLPPSLSILGDDFDWRARDYDGVRIAMLEELAARFPERKRWTAADLEVVLVEAMAAILDQLSDMADRVAGEGFLETAMRPETVRQLLDFIGYDAVAAAKAQDQIGASLQGEEAIKAVDAHWRNHPQAMDQAKLAGPREIHTQKRMVTITDYALRLREHPLIVDAHSWSKWSGSWYTVYITIIARANLNLDQQDPLYSEELQLAITNFHEGTGLDVPRFDPAQLPSVRMIIRPYIDAYRMAGQEVILLDSIYVGIYLSLSIRIAQNFYQSEMHHAIAQGLGTGPGGFFEPGKIGFGEDLYASDIIEALMQINGVEHVCLNRFKRIGSQYPDRVVAGFVRLEGLEVAACANDPDDPAMGYYRLTLHGGRKG